jgi:hypothetical protein
MVSANKAKVKLEVKPEVVHLGSVPIWDRSFVLQPDISALSENRMTDISRSSN